MTVKDVLTAHRCRSCAHRWLQAAGKAVCPGCDGDFVVAASVPAMDLSTMRRAS